MNSNAFKSPGQRYTGVAIAFHWLLALMIIGSFSVGWYMSDLPMSPTRLKLINWHKWAGVTILALSALRLLWRLTHRPPDKGIANRLTRTVVRHENNAPGERHPVRAMK